MMLRLWAVLAVLSCMVNVHHLLASPLSGSINAKQSLSKNIAALPKRSPSLINSVSVTGQSPLLKNIERLRLKGVEYLNRFDYHRASECYLASLQLLEGKGGQIFDDKRQRCQLALAECEYLLRKYQYTVLICSDLIDENPQSTNTTQIDVSLNSSTSHSSPSSNNRLEAISKVYYKRGLALEKLDQYRLAMNDYQTANQFTNDTLSQLRINLLSSSPILLNKTEQYDDIYDYIDHLRVNHPQSVLSVSQIERILHSKTTPVSPQQRQSSLNLFGSQQSNFPQLPLDSMLKGNGMNNLAAMGMNMLRQSNPEETIRLVGGMLGMKQASIKIMQEIYEACVKAISLFKSLSLSINKHKEIIVAILTVIWITAAVRQYFSTSRA